MKHAREDYNRIQDPENLIGADEPVFLLRAKDSLAPAMVENWAAALKASGGDYKMVSMALQHAEEMRQWQKENGCKLPDLVSQQGEERGIRVAEAETDGQKLVKRAGQLLIELSEVCIESGAAEIVVETGIKAGGIDYKCTMKVRAVKIK